MSDVFFQYAIEKGGIFGFLFILALGWIAYRENFFGMFHKQKDKKINNEIEDFEKRFSELEKQIEDLWDWHNVRDQDGVPVWYVKRSLEESIERIEESIKYLEDFMEKDLKNIESYLDKNDDLNNRIYEINNDRIEDYKKMLEDYNKTMKELTTALDKIKFVLRHKILGE